MKQFIKNTFLSLSALLVLVGGGVFVAAPAVAAPVDDACEGLALANPGVNCTNTTAQSNFNTLMTNIINIFSIVVGSISVLMIIIGGVRYVVSGGDSNATKGAKDTVMYALIGLVLVLFSQVIARFVLANAQP